MADVPENLLDQIEQLRTLFHVSPTKLRSITDHFVTELEKGLSKKGGNIPMIPGWVLDYPTGKEKGDYLAIDLGGTNLRVCLIKLSGNRDFDTTQSKFRLPKNIRTTSSDVLFDFIATSLNDFLIEQFPNGITHDLPLGFTFSYPASQDALNQGVLQRWTKGYDIKGVEGHDVVPMLQTALSKYKLPIKVVALINDTTGTLVASAYTDPETQMGLIFGTGCNGAYYEKVSAIPKLEGKLGDDVDQEDLMAINCEYGAFDNEHKVLPRTKYDVQIDEESPRPGQQTFEKMISGYYLGELMRLVLIDLYNDGFVFKNQDITKLKEPFILDTSVPAKIEEDPFENLEDTNDLFVSLLNITTTKAERKLIRKLAEFVGVRSSRLSVCGIAALAKKRGLTSAHAAADGSVYNKYPNFKERAAQGLDDIFGWNLPYDKHPIKIVAAEDGSGAGAAIIAALAEKRLSEGKSLGIKK